MERYAWILEVWNLEIGIPDLSAVIVASLLDLELEEARVQVQRLWLRTFGLEIGIGRTAARRGASPQGWPIKSIAIGRGRASE